MGHELQGFTTLPLPHTQFFVCVFPWRSTHLNHVHVTDADLWPNHLEWSFSGGSSLHYGYWCSLWWPWRHYTSNMSCTQNGHYMVTWFTGPVITASKGHLQKCILQPWPQTFSSSSWFDQSTQQHSSIGITITCSQWPIKLHLWKRPDANTESIRHQLPPTE